MLYMQQDALTIVPFKAHLMVLPLVEIDWSMTHCSQHQKVFIWLSNCRWSLETSIQAQQIGTSSCWSIFHPKSPCQWNTNNTTQSRSHWANLPEESQTISSMREVLYCTQCSFTQYFTIHILIRDPIELERQNEVSEPLGIDWHKFFFQFSSHNFNTAKL
jgi:hypothetical protein